MQTKLEEAHDEVQNLAHERQDLKEEVLVEIHKELKEDLKELDKEFDEYKEDLDQRLVFEKQERMAEY